MKEFDFNKEYGIVLEGGGAKGAYQIGVWKAFLEHGVKIKGVSGVSVGALNGALMTMGDFDEAERLWSNMTYSTVMNVNDIQMDKLMQGKIKEISIKEITKDTTKIIMDGGIDITPLKNLINEWVDEEKISNSDIELVLGTFSLTKLKEIEISAREADPSYLKDYLLASAYLPAFKSEKLHGNSYLDGGIMNSVPVDMLINRGYKNIIVVRIFGIGINKPVKIPKDVNVIEIAPRVDLGGILEFNQAKINRNIKIGYYDGLRILRGLKGKIYYLDWDYTEEDSLLYLFKVNESVKMALLEYYKLDISKPILYNRLFIESVCPMLANTLKLNKEWNYEDLLISLFELCAKTLKIQKYNIYARDEFSDYIHTKYEYKMRREEKFPLFEELILKLVTIRE
jgi:NTE family protein